MVGRSLLLAIGVTVLGIAATTATASQIVSTSSVAGVRLGVNDKGEAMITYTSDGQVVHVLAWGAENAIAPASAGQQVAFQLAYDGGYAKYFRDNPAAQTAIRNLRDLQSEMARATAARDNPLRYSLKPRIAAAFAHLGALRSAATTYWRTFSCPTYRGPTLPGTAAACKAPDGSYWAAESGDRGALRSGIASTPAPVSPGVRLVHWTGPLLPVTASRGITASPVTDITLGVNGKGEAMLTYDSRGKIVHVLAWGTKTTVAAPRQVAFELAYDGGYTKYFRHDPVAQAAVKHLRDLQNQMAEATAARDNPVRYALKPEIAAAFANVRTLRNAATNYWRTFTCPTYDGPALADLVAACKAPDGSYWAVQSWDRDLPDYGVAPTAAQSQIEVHLAHWTGPLAVLTVHADWAYGGRWNHLWGTYTYDGSGVHGFTSTARGVPLDSFGRNLYVDTFDSAYGPGWRRENSFLTHKPGGTWCYSVNPHGSHPAGTGSQYRLTILGLGVTPDVSITVPAPGPYDKAAQAPDNSALLALGDPLCIPH